MAATVSHGHTYTFSMSQKPTINELIAELTRAAEVMDGNSVVSINAGDSQRDGYWFTATINGPVNR